MKGVSKFPWLMKNRIFRKSITHQLFRSTLTPYQALISNASVEKNIPEEKEKSAPAVHMNVSLIKVKRTRHSPFDITVDSTNGYKDQTISVLERRLAREPDD